MAHISPESCSTKPLLSYCCRVDSSPVATNKPPLIVVSCLTGILLDREASLMMTTTILFQMLCVVFCGQLLLLVSSAMAVPATEPPLSRDNRQFMMPDRNNPAAAALPVFGRGDVNLREHLLALNRQRLAFGAQHVVAENANASSPLDVTSASLAKKNLRTASLEIQAATTGGPVSGDGIHDFHDS